MSQRDARRLSSMTSTVPTSTKALTELGEAMNWEDARAAFADARFYWMATVTHGGAPHVRPVLGVWLDGSMYSTSGRGVRKWRNLRRGPQCSLSMRTDDLDIVLEGLAQRVVAADMLELVRVAYETK